MSTKRIRKEDMEMQAPEPDDLGVEKVCLYDSPNTIGESLCVSGLKVAILEEGEERAPAVIIGQDGRYYVTEPWPEGGFIFF